MKIFPLIPIKFVSNVQQAYLQKFTIDETNFVFVLNKGIDLILCLSMLFDLFLL